MHVVEHFFHDRHFAANGWKFLVFIKRVLSRALARFDHPRRKWKRALWSNFLLFGCLKSVGKLLLIYFIWIFFLNSIFIIITRLTSRELNFAIVQTWFFHRKIWNMQSYENLPVPTRWLFCCLIAVSLLILVVILSNLAKRKEIVKQTKRR